MSAPPHSLAALRKSAKRADVDAVADDAGISTAMLAVPLTGVVGLAAGSTGLLGVLVTAVLVPFAIAMAAAMVVGGVEGVANVKVGRAYWPIGFAGASGAWAWLLDSWPAALILSALSLSLYVALYVRGNRAKKAAGPPALSDAVVQTLAALPRKLPPSVREALDRAIRCHAELHALLDSELAGDAAVVDAEAMQRDASACMAEIARLAGLMHRLRRAKAAPERQETLRARIVEVADGLEHALEAAVGFAAIQGGDAQAELAEQAERLHLTAAGLAEIERELEGAD
ncbi:MAG: hypothetical protein AAF721_39105 [Myxococcota bacterium]